MKKWFLALFAASASWGAPLDEREWGELPFENDPPEMFSIGATSVEMAIPSPVLDLPRKSPALTLTLSSLIPGFGHVYLGDMKTAGALFGSAGAGLGLALYEVSRNHESVTGSLTIQTAWFYGLYAAYRDVRIYNRQEGYSYPMPKEGFADLTYAPFKFSVLKKPEVWGGVLGALAVGVGLAYLTGSEKESSSKGKFFPAAALPVAIGEEALFRGYLQPLLSEWVTPWGGLALSSLLFGAVHIPNAAFLAPSGVKNYYLFGIPFITGMGAYFGWLAQKNHSLKESVAVHMWYDFVVFAASYMASRTSLNKRADFAITIPF